MKTVLLLIIRFYRRFISPLKPPCCRFYPTCSAYAMQAITEHGVLRGGFLALRRILKCHPFHAGGYDPVPEARPCGHGRLHSDESFVCGGNWKSNGC